MCEQYKRLSLNFGMIRYAALLRQWLTDAVSMCYLYEGENLFKK